MGTNTTNTTSNTTTYAINAVRPALVKAHELGNAKAISKDLCYGLGITEERFTQWVHWVNNLRDVIIPYVSAKHNKDVDEKTLKTLRGKIYPQFRTILKAGEEDVFHKNMFVREQDVDSLVGYAEKFIADDNFGTLQSIETATKFRCKVEALIGCKMAANEVVTDKDRDTLATYQSAQKSIKSNTELLDGRENDNGEHVKGVNEKLADAETELENFKATLAELELSDEVIAIASAQLAVVVSGLKTQKDNAKKQIDEATKTVNSLETKVFEIREKLKTIE